MLQTRDDNRPSRLSDFFAKRYERLVRACVLLTGRATEGEDLAQEAMPRVLERWDRVSAMDEPEGYLYRTALNVHRKALMQRRDAPTHAHGPLLYTHRTSARVRSA